MGNKMPRDIIRLNEGEIKMAEDFLEKVKSGEVTHGFLCYRNLNGEVNYQLYAPEHLTYIIGMMERCKIDIALP
jgi:hypothetical protein